MLRLFFFLLKIHIFDILFQCGLIFFCCCFALLCTAMKSEIFRERIKKKKERKSSQFKGFDILSNLTVK